MSRSKKEARRIARELLDEQGTTYAEECGIRLKNSPATLFQLLYACLLLGTRIRASNATEAAAALRRAGLTTPRKMVDASWQDRVDVITWHGYKRFDERTATRLGQLSERLLKDYHGDLRRLRDEAARRPAQERRLLREFNGIGPVGANIFMREVQGVWPEVYPFVDDRVAGAARDLGLPTDASNLSQLVPHADFARFVAALTRYQLAHRRTAS